MSDLTTRFEAAVANSKNLSERPDNATLLKIYALYKQGTVGDTTAVFRDSAFENDIAKSNLAAVLEQHGVKHVRSL